MKLRPTSTLFKMGCYVPANGYFSKRAEKPIDIFPRTDTMKNGP